jgi:hypothetical protein
VEKVDEEERSSFPRTSFKAFTILNKIIVARYNETIELRFRTLRMRAAEREATAREAHMFIESGLIGISQPTKTRYWAHSEKFRLRSLGACNGSSKLDEFNVRTKERDSTSRDWTLKVSIPEPWP